MKAVEDPKRFADNASAIALTKLYSAIALLTCMAESGRASGEAEAYESLGTVCQAADGVRALLDDIYMDIDRARDYMKGMTNATA